MADAEYSTPVYREQETGKVRVKGATKIDLVSESPVDTTEVAEAVNQILNLLTAAGINPEE